MVGAAMHQRFLTEGKPGVTMRARRELLDVVERRPADDGVLPQHDRAAHRDDRQPDARCTIPFVPSKQLPRLEPLPAPIEPQAWHFRQSIDYSITANCAVLDFASRYKEQFLYNIYRMGRDQIERGSARSLDDLERRHDALAGGDERRRRRRPGGGRRRGTATDAAAATAAARTDAAAAAAVDAVQPAPTTRAEGSGAARSARLHHSVEPARLPDRDEVHQHAASRPASTIAAGDRAVHRRRQELSGRLVRREDGAGVPRRT